MRRADLFRAFAAAALRRLRERGIDRELLHLLVGNALASFPVHRREAEVRLKIAEEIRGRLRGRVLDVGCGTGLFSLHFATHPGVKEVVAIDSGERFLPARDVAADLGLPARFHRRDFLELEGAGKFDRVLFIWVLHDLDDPGPYLSSAREHLAPQGAIVVGDVDLGGLRDRLRRFAGVHGLRISLEDRDEMVSHGRAARAFIAVLSPTGP